jgi:membrane protease YdiL (CAAX protease family)
MMKNNKEAFKLTMGSFSLFYVAGIFLAAIAFAIIMQFDSSAQQLIEQPNPALDVSPTVALVMMGVAMLVVGPAEEYLFRGFLFGGLLSIFKGKHWFVLGIVSSLIFSLAHGYYAITYGVVSPIFYIQLTLFGMAMCLAYYWSGGNLVALAVIHGLSDAIGFLGVATTRTVGLTAQGIFLAVGLVFGVFYVLLKKVRINPARISGEPQPQIEQRAH